MTQAEREDGRTQAAEPWVCPVCYCGNRAEDLFCVICGAERPDPAEAVEMPRDAEGGRAFTLAPPERR